SHGNSKDFFVAYGVIPACPRLPSRCVFITHFRIIEIVQINADGRCPPRALAGNEADLPYVLVRDMYSHELVAHDQLETLFANDQSWALSGRVDYPAEPEGNPNRAGNDAQNAEQSVGEAEHVAGLNRNGMVWRRLYFENLLSVDGTRLAHLPLIHWLYLPNF